MVKKAGVEVSSRLIRVKERFAAWRHKRTRGERIPERLWNAAVEVAADIGVNQTATALVLDYYALRRRLEERTTEPLAPAFIELPGPPAVAASTVAVSECIVELEDDAGQSMRIHIKGVDLASIASLGQSLWKAK